MSFISSLLAQIGLLKEGYQIGLDGLGQFARVIIEGVGVLGAGIIVFTLVLKAITLPFDIYQRVKMRKQTLLMRQMQPDLEKLQQQYKDDKNMYNQKMMELYKKNGYSMLGACLPMLISLVILIVAFQGFRTYSNYANLKMYVNMSHEYNAAVLAHSEKGEEFLLPDRAPEGYKYVINWTETPVTETQTETEEQKNENGEVIATIVTTTTTTDIVHTENGIVYTYRTVVIETKKGEETNVSKPQKTLYVQSEKEEKYVYYSYPLDVNEYAHSYYVDSDRLKAAVGETAFAGYFNAQKETHPQGETETEEKYIFRIEELACKDYARYIGASAAADWYRENSARFLWVKNVWYPDVSYQHPIQDYKGFSGSFKGVKVTYPEDGTKKDLLNEMDPASYEDLVSELTAETKTPNGYFILIILSIGLMVLSQFISMRSNKESNKYQTVDGSGAKTQKMMLVMMPLIYAIFAFMYSAAFSIYMVISSAVAILVTLLSNLIIGAVFKKKEKQLEEEKTVRKLPWMKDDGADKDKKRKNNGKRG